MKKNKNRGYQKLRVWEDAIEFYKDSSQIFRNLPFELKRVSSQATTSADSVHRNIAEGFCRRSIQECIQHLYNALGSLGESVSGFYAYFASEQIRKEDFERLDNQAYKLENGLLRLVESLERNRDHGNWNNTLILKESNAIYDVQ